MTASSIIPPRTPPTMGTIFELLPPGDEDAPASRDKGLHWDEIRELELMVENAVGVEEVLVELEPLAVSPEPILGLSDERTREAAEKEDGEEDPYHQHTRW